jgi:hypothetical protein
MCEANCADISKTTTSKSGACTASPRWSTTDAAVKANKLLCHSRLFALTRRVLNDGDELTHIAK